LLSELTERLEAEKFNPCLSLSARIINQVVKNTHDDLHNYANKAALSAAPYREIAKR